MNPTLLVQIALTSTSAAIALILLVAWQEFGRPRHALIWASAFAVSTAMWALALVPAAPAARQWLMTAMFALAGVAAALNTAGFRQRAVLSDGRAPLAIAAAGHAVVQVVLMAAGTSVEIRLAPLSALNAVLFWLASDTLRGRRKGERAAERVAEFGLLLMCTVSVTLMIGVVATVAGLFTLDVREAALAALLLLPAVIVAMGLFAIVLLAADLADQARRLAATDILTGALNRRGFDEAARAMIEAALRTGRDLTVVLADMDHFKRLNDRFGHPAGDRVLRQMSGCIAHATGGRDLMARVGGEEFALALADTDIAAAARRMEELRRAIATMTPDLPEPHPVTASFGLAQLHAEDGGLAGVLLRADAALYRSKAEGRNRLTVA